jgi:integrase
MPRPTAFGPVKTPQDGVAISIIFCINTKPSLVDTTRPCAAAAALEFLILTAARTNEVLGAKWEEIDLANKVWTVPATRMKSGRVHPVPLSSPALEIIAKQQVEQIIPARRSAFVFPGKRAGRPSKSYGHAVADNEHCRHDTRLPGIFS